MAAVQATIPFKSRKKTYTRSAKVKGNVENVDILNTGKVTKTKKLKRQNVEDHGCNFESDCHNGKYLHTTKNHIQLFFLIV